MKRKGKHVWKLFLDMLFPSRCIFCRKEGPYISHPYKVKLHNIPQPANTYFDNLGVCVSAFPYHNDLVKTIVEYFKFHGFGDLADEMAEFMVGRMDNTLKATSVVLVPVPLHWTRLFWRGFNQSFLLAKALAEKSDHIQVKSLLKRVRKTKQQAALTKTERMKNVEGVFALKKDIVLDDEVLYVVLDDVTATGSTLKEAMKVIRAGGGKNIAAWVFARSL